MSMKRVAFLLLICLLTLFLVGCDFFGNLLPSASTTASPLVTATASCTAHVFDNGQLTKEPTCTEGGIYTVVCLECGFVCPQAIAPTGVHRWDEGEVLIAPTDTEEGEIFFTCLDCDETKTEVRKPLKKDLSQSIIFTDSIVKYNGNPVSLSTYRAIGYNSAILDAEYIFFDMKGNYISGPPINVGQYIVAVRFSFKDPSDAEKYHLPFLVNKYITILPVDAWTLSSASFREIGFGNIAFYPYDGQKHGLHVGTMPPGLEPVYTMFKTHEIGGYVIDTPELVPNDPNGVPYAVEPGWYELTVTFIDRYGNYNPDSLPSLNALITIGE